MGSEGVRSDAVCVRVRWGAGGTWPLYSDGTLVQHRHSLGTVSQLA